MSMRCDRWNTYRKFFIHPVISPAMHLLVSRSFVVLATLITAAPTFAAERHTGPWNMAELKQPPAAEFGAKSGLVQEVYYDGEPFGGKPTWVFAYYGRPEGDGPF